MVKDNGRESKDRGTWESETKKTCDKQMGLIQLSHITFLLLLLKKILKQGPYILKLKH